MPYSRSMIAFTLAAAALAATPALAGPRGFAHVGNRANGAGVVAGPRGVAGRAHTTVQNADGSTTFNRAGGFAGVNGARGYRQSSTTVGADGSVSRSGSAAASGANGSVQSAGGFTRSANGTWSGSRSTSATNANTGTSYSGSTTIDPTTGKAVHTGICTNAGGQQIACR